MPYVHRLATGKADVATRRPKPLTSFWGLIGSCFPPAWLTKPGCHEPGSGDATSPPIFGEIGPTCFEDLTSFAPHLHARNQTSMLESPEPGSNHQTRTRCIPQYKHEWMLSTRARLPPETCALPRPTRKGKEEVCGSAEPRTSLHVTAFIGNVDC
jgi:hypothetical protein